MPIGYTGSQREYWAQRPSGIIKYDTVEFTHPDFGSVRLVSDLFDKTFPVDGVDQMFTAVAMQVPSVTSQTVDTTNSGTIIFGRIGQQFRDSLLKITPIGAITSPISVTLRAYRNDVVEPVYERSVFVNTNGISISDTSVTVRLSSDNPGRLRNKTRFYDPAIWVGLQTA